MLKLIKKLMVLFVLFFIIGLGNCSKVNAAPFLYFDGKMTNGKDIYYWIDSSCQYTASIPQAVSKLRYPSGMWNPMVLNKTTTKSYSKMDFYQYYDENSTSPAGTNLYPAKINGKEQNPLSKSDANSMDWAYTKIYINDAVIYPQDLNGQCRYDPDLLSTIILHVICHAYGGNHVFEPQSCIMYYKTDFTIRGLCSDFNDVLVQKYNY